MKKVICISNDWGKGLAELVSMTGIKTPVITGKYTVIEEGKCSCKTCGQIIYALAEVSNSVLGISFGWPAKNFVPVSDIDETEFVRETLKEKV